LPKYNEINWELAECRGMYTDLFYRVEEERNVDAYFYINAVREVCARCPLWKACFQYAYQHERFGVWGGMTSLERASFDRPEKYPVQRQRALRSLSDFGITLENIRSAIEHTDHVGSLADKVTTD
jgi:hypothetical protein